MKTLPLRHTSNLMSDVVSTDNLNMALEHVSKRRAKASANDDIWHVRYYWEHVKNSIRSDLLTGKYHLSPMRVFKTKSGLVSCWSGYDAVVLRAISQVLGPLVGEYVGKRCYHLKGHGGRKVAVSRIEEQIKHHEFVLRSDVAQFYDSMQISKVVTACKKVVKDRRILRIIAQLIERVETFDGEYILKNKGIPKGCSLSPLIGGLIMKSLGERLPKGAFYGIYMDDWVILTKTRGALRRAIKWMHRVMEELGFKLALDKTYIGRIKNGFDFLGYCFNHGGVTGLSMKTIQKFIARVLKLYEQGSSKKRIEQYVRRWAGCNRRLEVSSV